MSEMLNTCWNCGCPTRNFDSFRLSNGELYESSLCDACKRKFAAERSFENTQYLKEQITCPYCGYEEVDSWEYGEDEDEFKCPCCERESNLEVEVEVRYTTSRKTDDMPADYEYREIGNEC